MSANALSNTVGPEIFNKYRGKKIFIIQENPISRNTKLKTGIPPKAPTAVPKSRNKEPFNLSPNRVPSSLLQSHKMSSRNSRQDEESITNLTINAGGMAKPKA